MPRTFCERSSEPLKDRLLQRSYIQKHSLSWFILIALQRNKPIFCVPADFLAIGLCNNAAATNLLRDNQADLERFRQKQTSQASSLEAIIYGEPCQQDQRQVMGGQSTHVFLWEGIPRNTGSGQGEIAKNCAGRRFIHRYIGNADRDLLL